METPTNYNENYAHSGNIKVKRVYWGAIFAGAVVMLIGMILLNLLGLGIGFGSVNPVTESNPFQGLGTGALIWWIISNIAAIFAGGYVAGRMAGIPHKQSGILHGIVSWCIFTIVTVWIYTTAIGAVISGVGSVVSGAFSGVTQVIGAIGESGILENIDIEKVRQEVNYGLREAGVADTVSQISEDVQISTAQFREIVKQLFIKDGQINTQVSRQEIVNVLAQETDLSRAQVEHAAEVLERQSEKVQQEWQEVKQKAEQTGQDLASAASSAAIWTFVALLIGVFAAAIAGAIGIPAHFLHEELHIIR